MAPLYYTLLGLAFTVVVAVWVTAALLRTDRRIEPPPETDAERTGYLLPIPDQAPTARSAAQRRRPTRPAPAVQSWPPQRDARTTGSGAHRPVRRTAAPGHTPDPEVYVGEGRHRIIPADESYTRSIPQVRRDH